MTNSRLDTCQNVLDVRECARRRLPSPIFAIIDGAAETEVTARRNTEAFDEVKLVPHHLVDVTKVDTATRIFGQDVQWPVFCSPTGASRLFHPEGELAVARAAAATGTLYALSVSSTYSLEEVAAASAGPKMFQLYFRKDREVMDQLIERCRRAGYAALCLTIDVPAYGKHERAFRSGFTMPLKWSLSNILSYARRPRWLLGQLHKGPLYLAHSSEQGGPSPILSQRPRAPLDPSMTWKDVRKIRDQWGGFFVLKGVMSGDDARRAEDVGATAVIVSNHGGRQLDGAAASLEILPEVVEAVGARLDVILDGGIRRGTHVLKALALGAKACSVGRPYLYGLSASGEAGVARVLNILRAELTLAMRLSGCPDLASIDASRIRRFRT